MPANDRLFRYIGDEKGADPATKEALRYRSALHMGWKMLQSRPINTNMAEQICSEIKSVQMTVRRVPGTRLANHQSGEVIYTPPEGETLLRNLLANWERVLYEQKNWIP